MTKSTEKPLKLFISHSSKDKAFAVKLGESLKAKSYDVWLDSWVIKVGQSITAEIQRGLDDSNYVILVLSQHSVASRWVEREWHSKHWKQVQEGKVFILPALLEKCDVPTLLGDVLYADFTKGYTLGLNQILDAIGGELVVDDHQSPIPVPTSVNVSELTSLLKKAHDHNLKLSAVFVEALEFALKNGLTSLADFCRGELTTRESTGKTNEHKEQTAVQFPWRVSKFYLSQKGQLNPSSMISQSQTLLWEYIEGNPTEFVWMRFIWPDSLAQLEQRQESMGELGIATAIVLKRKNFGLVDDPNAPVHLYAKPDALVKLLRGIRSELISRLMALVPTVPN